MSAVTALPYLNLRLLEDLLHLHIVEELAVALLMRLLNRANGSELSCQIREALFLRILSHALIHISPLVVLTLGCGLQIGLCVALQSQMTEPELGMFLLVVRRLLEESRNLLKSLLLGHGREESILIPGL